MREDSIDEPEKNPQAGVQKRQVFLDSGWSFIRLRRAGMTESGHFGFPVKPLLFLVAIVFLLLALKGNSYSQDVISPLSEKYSSSIVAVIALDRKNRTLWTGTGFFINSQGVIATSHHVLEGSARAVVRLYWESLQERSVRFHASMADTRVTEVFVARHQTQGGEGAGPLHTRSKSSPGTVYFKNGKEILCDAAWKEAGTVFLVIHGKGYAVGYKETEIDMKKSFDL